MAKYDPFERGPHPAGVRSVHWTDPARERTLPVEVWYPATDAYRGRDTDETTRDRFKPLPFAPEVSQDAVRDAHPLSGAHPLVVFSHGFGGDRRQTTHLCTHWASHGYAVVAMDHVGNTTGDLMQLGMGGERPDPRQLVAGFIADRPSDASFVLDCALRGDAGVEIDPERVGMAGHSFGGWTTLATTARNERVRAALPLAPAGGRTPLAPPGPANVMADALSLEWSRPVPTLYLVAELDTLLPLDGMRELLARTPAPARGVVLKNADHFHFCDRVEQVHDMFRTMAPVLMGGAMGGADAPDLSGVLGGMKTSAELCPGDHAYAFLRGLGLAHMDAHLRGDPAARALLEEDPRTLLAARGIEAEPL